MKYAYYTTTQEAIMDLLRCLINMSIWFEVDPLPENEWMVCVKEEHMPLMEDAPCHFSHKKELYKNVPPADGSFDIWG